MVWGRKEYVVRMIDMSGYHQSPENVRVPSPREIAIVLGRLCRYAGNLPCSVLSHVMIGAPLVWGKVRSGSRDTAEMTFAWWMLHDAHEAVTGDFASHKSEEVEEWQETIDRAIAEEYKIDPDKVRWSVIGEVDLLARYLETEHYGSIEFFKAFKTHADGYKVPTPEMKRSALGVLYGQVSKLEETVVPSNSDGAHLPGPVSTYEMILAGIECGDRYGAIEVFDGMVMELGLEH